MKYTWMGVRTLLGMSRNPIRKVSLSQNLQKETMYSSPLAVSSLVLRKRRLTTSVIAYEAGDCRDNSEGLKVELLKWDLRGNTILIPAADQQVLSTLKRIKNVMQPGHHLLSIIAGDDYKRIQDSSPFRKLVRRLIDGVGPTAAVKLEEYYEGNVRALLDDNEDGWKEAGLHVGQRKTLGELLHAN